MKFVVSLPEKALNNKMDESFLHMCRTCLKSSADTLLLTNHATGCNPKRTYGQLLKEYANLECIADYERFMPQFLCQICCRELRNTYAFIKQAQYCNTKLISVISNQLDCLEEKTIDLPENESDVEKKIEIKMETDIDESQALHKKQQNTEIYEFSLENFNEDETVDDNEDVKDIEFLDGEQNDSNDDLPLECSSVSDYNKNIDDSQVNTEELQSDCGDVIEYVHTQSDNENQSESTRNSKLEEKQVFSCQFCSATYNSKYTYLYHLKYDHNIDETRAKRRKKAKTIKCCSCNYIARSYSAFYKHKVTKHGAEKKEFKCKFCSHVYLKKLELLTHVKNSHKEMIKTDEDEAEIKGETQNDNTTLEPEKSIAENAELYSDDNMPIEKLSTSNSNTETEEEKEQFNDEEFVKNISDIKSQSELPAKSLARRCDECGNVYKDYKSLYIHKRYVHISEDKYHICPHCGKKYKRKNDLKIHTENTHSSKHPSEIKKRIHKTKEKRFMCSECSYICATITLLRVHVSRHHSGEKPYKCDFCFKSFVVPYELKIHRYLHTGERPYKCPVCSKGYRDSSLLVKHKLLHTGERPHKCNECDKSFTRPYNLTLHKRTHRSEKPYQCPECVKAFKRADKLKFHMRVHSELRPYKCTECDKAFKYHDVLQSHMHKHTGEKPFSCKICGETFSLRSSLHYHRTKYDHR